MYLYLTLTICVLLLARQVRGARALPAASCDMPPAEPFCASYAGPTRQQALNAVCMGLIFFLLFLVPALRVNVGNDYGKYVEFMHLVYSGAYVPTEVGFNLLTDAVYHLFGYENFHAVFAVLAFATAAFFLASMRRLSDDFFISFAMFMLLGYYFQSFSTVRYYLALAIALYGIRYVISGDWPRFALLVLAGAAFHKSLLVVLVFYPLARLPWKRWMLAPAALLCVSFLAFPAQYLSFVVRLYPSYQETEYLSGGTSYVSIARCAASLLFVFLFAREAVRGDAGLRFFVKCNVLALLLYVFCAFLPVISRIGYYLTATQLFLIPAVLTRIGEKRKRRFWTGLILGLCLLYFANFMRQAGNDGIRILPYRTFLFHDMPTTLSEMGFN